ncbi:MAG: phosphoenolpyruvate synthase [Nanoarchaeota archaeon]|nr:phosphoenolpyruvate synthase [Nanoarchaeota archaeon]
MKEEKERYIAWLSELSKEDTAIAGGKGANLGEMFNVGLPVPQAFVVTTQAYNYFLSATGLNEKINKLLSEIDVEDTKKLEQYSKEIKKIIISAEMPEDLQREILESYDNLNVTMDLKSLKNMPNVLSIMKTAKEPIFVSVRSSATAEDSGAASFAGQNESFINVKGNTNVIESVKKVFASIFTARSIYYRKKKGFNASVEIAAIVQKMIDSVKSGVMFSVNPISQENNNILIEAVFGQGEGIVSGQIKPDGYTVTKDNLEIIKEEVSDKKIAIVRDSSGETKKIKLTEEKSTQKVLKVFEIKELANYAIKLEEHYGKPQDIEFAIDNSEIYIVQTRPITTLSGKKESHEIQGEILLSGLSASPGIGSGIVKIVLSMDDLDKIKIGDVLVTKMTNPDMVVTMQRASAIVTDEGGSTSHAAIVSREMGIPAVVGTGNATSTLKDGMEITVDGSNGKVYAGKTETKKVEVLPIVETKIKIKVLVDLPEFAERAAKTNAYGVGLVRIEGIIASSGKHPLYYSEKNKIDEYKELLKKGIEKIASAFKGKEVWVRTSDIRTDEFSNLEGAPKEIELNPMMGFHGIRFSLKHLDIFKAELNAIKELAGEGHKFGIMFPQIISPKEVEQIKKIMNELNMLDNPNIRMGVMIETPAAVMLIEDLCKQGISFISFGTNDLTQFTLAVDRGNEHIQDLYDESNLAVLKQISRVIRTCKQYDVETSICGQAGSEKKVVEFLVHQGIDSISVNADAAREISEFVKELEEKGQN